MSTINIIYHFKPFTYTLIMIYMDTVNIYYQWLVYHIQPVIYTDHFQFIITANIHHLHQPLLYNTIFEYVNIAWHYRGL